MGELDFDLFDELLERHDVEAVKRLVTPENVMCGWDDVHDMDDGVVWCLCNNDRGPDEPELLHYFVGLGASLGTCLSGRLYSPIHTAAFGGKTNLVRAFLDYYDVPVDIVGLNWTPLGCAVLHNHRSCVHLLLDRGADVSGFQEFYLNKKPELFPLLQRFIHGRNRAQTATLVILNLMKEQTFRATGNGKDVLRMIARCVWATRENKKWEAQE